MKPTLIYGIYSLVLYILIAWQYRRINKAIFLTPLVIQFLTFSISFFTIIHLYVEDFIPEKTFLLLLIQFILYFLTFMITPYIVGKKNSNIKKFINIRSFDIKSANYIFYISFIISITYIVLFWTIYSVGSDRLYFNRDFRILSLLCTLFTLWSISISSLIYAKTKINKFLFHNIIIILLLGFMGSKGLSIVGVFVFIFFYLQFNKLNKKYFFIVSALLFILVVLPTQIMYGNAMDVILDRIMMSGDIYLFSFVLGDYTELINFYEPVAYLIHPFSSIFGIRGYDFPLGAQILETANIPVTGVGPQDHMTILALTFFPKSTLSVITFTLMVCFLIIFFMKLNFYILSLKKIHLVLRSIIFVLIYTQIINIFVGINAFSFNVILSIVAICMYVFTLLMKDFIIAIQYSSRKDKYAKK